MLRPSLCLVAVALALAPAMGQTVLFPVLDAAGPAGLGNPDNHSAFVVVQPSRHGMVSVLPLLTGTTGYQALPIVSLDGRYANDNSSLTTTFTSLDELNHLIFPNPFHSQATNWLTLVGPLASGVLTPFMPETNVSGPTFQELAVYFQIAEVQQISASPPAYDFHFSNGLTMVQTEAGGSVLGTGLAGPSSKLGAALASGDLNGDGVDDLVVGAPGAMAGGRIGAGRVYIHLGIARTATVEGGLHPVPYVLEEPNLSAVLVGENPGPETQAHFGASVAIGDLDGDGRAELVVAAPEGDGVSGEPDQGEVYVYRSLDQVLGAAPIIAPQLLSVPAATIVQVRPVIERAFARYGSELAVGDINGDHVDDLVASAPFVSVALNQEQEAGAAYLFLGPFGTGSFRNQEDSLMQDAVLGQYEHFGGALALGDLNGDGVKDLVIGVPGETVNGVNHSGKLIGYAWSPQGMTEILSVANPLPITNAGLGLSLAAGDVDGDGDTDLVSASDEAVGPAANAGYVHVWRLQGGTLAGYERVSTAQPYPFERFGRRVQIADMNADGIGDVVVGSPGCPAGGLPFAGVVFVYFGNPGPSINDDFRMLAIDSTQAQTYGLFGAAFAIGDFAGVGVNDLAVGEPLASTPGASAGGRVAIFDDLLHRKDNRTLPQLQAGAPPSP